MTTDKEAVRVEPMTHLERARARITAFEEKYGLLSPAERDFLVESFATLLAQVTNEALERAAGVTVLLDNQMSQRDVSYEIRKAIRSLKEPRQ